MGFPEKLVEFRKNKNLSQATLSKRVGIHVSQVKRYEAGTSQPTLDVLKNLAVELGCTTDELAFGADRGPSNELRLQFETISTMDEESIKFIKDVLDALILRHQAKQWTKAS